MTRAAADLMASMKALTEEVEAETGLLRRGEFAEIGDAVARKQQAAARYEAALKTFTGSSAAGAVQIDVSGAGEFEAVRLDPSVVDPTDVSLLEDLLLAALRDASSKVAGANAESMDAVAGGLAGGLGGLSGLGGGLGGALGSGGGSAGGLLG